MPGGADRLGDTGLPRPWPGPIPGSGPPRGRDLGSRGRLIGGLLTAQVLPTPESLSRSIRRQPFSGKPGGWLSSRPPAMSPAPTVVQLPRSPFRRCCAGDGRNSSAGRRPGCCAGDRRGRCPEGRPGYRAGGSERSGAGRQGWRRCGGVAEHCGQGHHQGDQSDGHTGQEPEAFRQWVGAGGLTRCGSREICAWARTSTRTVRVLSGGGGGGSRGGSGREGGRIGRRQRRAGGEGKALVHGGWMPQRTTEFISAGISPILPAWAHFRC